MTEEELDSLAVRWHRHASAPETLKRYPMTPPRRVLRWMPVTALVASGLIAVGVVSLSWKPLPAFAEVERGFEAIQMAQWEEETEEYDEARNWSHHSLSQISIRRTPAALLRVNIRDGKPASQGLLTPDAQQTYEPISNTLTIRTKNAVQQKSTRSFLNCLLSSQLNAQSRTSDASEYTWKKRLVDGELVYERERVTRYFKINTHFRERVWVNPKNLHILRSEALQESVEVPRTRWVMRCRNIRYNPTLPKNHFRITTNAATKVRSTREIYHLWATLSGGERKEILTLLKSAMETWNRGEADSFCSYWDFAFRNRNQIPGAQPTADLEKEWRIRTRNQGKFKRSLPWRVTKLDTCVWTNAVKGDVLPEGEVLHIEADDVRFVLSRQTGRWKIVDMYYRAQRRK